MLEPYAVKVACTVLRGRESRKALLLPDRRGSAAVDENRFWSLIELAWDKVGETGNFRRRLAGRKLSRQESQQFAAPLDEFVRMLKQELDHLPAEELLAFHRLLRRKLYDLDCEDVHGHIGGSDDGFLHARGFVVAAGRSYFESVLADPKQSAGQDLVCASMCFLAGELYRKKFGKPDLGISITTGSNKGGWPRVGLKEPRKPTGQQRVMFVFDYHECHADDVPRGGWTGEDDFLRQLKGRAWEQKDAAEEILSGYGDSEIQSIDALTDRVREFFVAENGQPEEVVQIPFDKLTALMTQGSWSFVGGSFMEFEGNHNDSEITVVLEKASGS